MKEFRGTPGEWTYEPSNPYDGVEWYWLNADGYQIGSVDGRWMLSARPTPASWPHPRTC